MNVLTRLVCAAVVLLVLLYALHSKGEVRAVFKALGVELSLDAKERLLTPSDSSSPKPSK